MNNICQAAWYPRYDISSHNCDNGGSYFLCLYDSTQYTSSSHPDTMALCYGLARRILGYTRHTDDRPFTQEKKQVLPIRGFKGNRVIYGDISDDEDEDILTKDEPLYSEPVFTLSSYKDSGLSSLDSGYTVSDSQGYYSDDQTEFFSSTPGILPSSANCKLQLAEISLFLSFSPPTHQPRKVLPSQAECCGSAISLLGIISVLC